MDGVLFAAMASLFAVCGGDLADLFRGKTSSFAPARFHAVGDTRYVMKATLVAECACWIPLIVLVLVVRPDIVLLWWTIVLWHGLSAALLFRRWRSGTWRRIQLI